MYKRDETQTTDFNIDEYDDEPSILTEEVKKALNSIKDRKSPGHDEIPIELLKECGEEGIETLKRLCQNIWDNKQWPKDWKRSIYVPIPKKGDARECGNNRTIALISHTSKVLLKIIQGRLEQFMETQLPVEQAGFRRGRGTRDQIANLRWIMEKTREADKDIIMCFIDYSKAFDCVDHNRLWKILGNMGAPAHLIHLLQQLYNDQEASVRTEFGETQWFGIGKGVRQGCILSPYLFNLYSEMVMRNATEHAHCGIKIGGRVVNNLRYADDTTLLTDNKRDLVKYIELIKKESEKAGLFLNIKKTKIMASKPMDDLIIAGESIEVIDSFVFLGAKVMNEGGCSEEIRRRIILGRKAMADLTKIWKDRDVSLDTKTRLVKALVHPIITYAAETWTIRKEDRKRIDAMEMWCWRKMMSIPWKAMWTNKAVLEKIKQPRSLYAEIIKQKLSYFGHIARKQGDCLEKDIMIGYTEGKRKRGRPRARWLDDVESSTARNLNNLIAAAQDRVGWRALVKSVTRSRTRLDGSR